MTAATQYCNQDDKEDFGDFVRNEDEEMDLEEVAEPWDRYDKTITSDVFYPIRLGDLINERKLSMTTCMSAALQLLEALGILHEAGIVHRDLNERNCMWGMQPLHHLPRNAKYKALGRPLKQTIPVDDLWKEGELVGPANIPPNLQTQKFYLGDFGLAKKLSDPVTPCGYPPLQYCPLPEEWKGLYTHSESRDSWYNYQNQTTPDPKWTLESRLAYFRPDADLVERSHVLSIISRVLTYDPAKRMTASQLLRDPSFRAIMEIMVVDTKLFVLFGIDGVTA
ncbi:kinase-like protein [Aspergillus vadensis CBS 113365]|uniref:Kinase-like protein n=1 Tax=Aspergillus vadensis (strain CBS 113365 / IMI 142717 / IBT 24658) TaxID=1448311 RepID=A0A319BPK3_ASPVC|nr:kinase-like protein [Aspergillus vadensis CBS 113365]PYH74311.1 kinase-like protein [Aspergillus vadensis CBS 113365]